MSHPSALMDAMSAAGGIVAEYHGRPVVRHFGDSAAEYEAATSGLAVFDRSHRTRLRVSGRAPTEMLKGVLTGRMPEPPGSAGGDVRAGEATYHAVLTPKGKMITDLWALLLGPGEAEGLLLDVPVAGSAGLLDTLGRVLPPRFARVEDVSERTAAISVVGPRAASALTRLALGLRVDVEALEAASEGAWWAAGSADSVPVVMRTAEVWPAAFTVYGAAEHVAALWGRLVEEGAAPAGLAVWSTLRVEAGRPAFGTDMDEGTIPVEAGIHDRAIDYGKGCYTGQEVIVRIRDRGHVNRHLRRLSLGDVPTPARGTELFEAGADSDKAVGRITSAVESPREGGVVALAYVRRGVRAVAVDGREVEVPEA